MIEALKAAMTKEGIDIFGTSDCRSVVANSFADTPYALTLGIRLSDAVVNKITEGPNKIYFAHYRSVNALLDACALKCIVMIQREGYNAIAVPASQTTSSAGIAGDFPHKTAANLAGLGFVGKSGLFVTTQYGPRVRFATVLTDMQLKSSTMIEPQCKECNECVRACPCGAIIGAGWKQEFSRDEIVDAALCSRYMKEKYQNIGRGSVCGICMAVCPIGVNS